ncbi:hypothetical protein [Paraburkholderia phytofirmans]|nr:hypothetical protein [Paraburkholderia phytofirmans]
MAKGQFNQDAEMVCAIKCIGADVIAALPIWQANFYYFIRRIL